MKTIDNNWKVLSKLFNPGLNEILYQQYFAAQFIAMTGRHLIKQRQDDSNTSMVFNPHTLSLVGELLSGDLRTSLNLSDLSLALLRDDSPLPSIISLPGLDMKSALSLLRQGLDNAGIKGDNLIYKLHYDLPDHKLLKGSLFFYDQPELISENIAYRHNAEIVLNEIISQFKQAESVRIWPHHFDTGTLIPLKHGPGGELAMSVGLGWAIPDGMVDEPYYYLSIWSSDTVEFPTPLQPLIIGNWRMPAWNGAVLKLSEIINYRTAEEQYECVLSFFKSGIEIVQGFIKP